MEKFAKTIIHYLLFFVVIFFSQDCAAQKIIESGNSSMSIESPQKFIDEIKSTGPNLLIKNHTWVILTVRNF